MPVSPINPWVYVATLAFVIAFLLCLLCCCCCPCAVAVPVLKKKKKKDEDGPYTVHTFIEKKPVPIYGEGQLIQPRVVAIESTRKVFHGVPLSGQSEDGEADDGNVTLSTVYGESFEERMFMSERKRSFLTGSSTYSSAVHGQKDLSLSSSSSSSKNLAIVVPGSRNDDVMDNLLFHAGVEGTEAQRRSHLVRTSPDGLILGSGSGAVPSSRRSKIVISQSQSISHSQSYSHSQSQSQSRSVSVSRSRSLWGDADQVGAGAGTGAGFGVPISQSFSYDFSSSLTPPSPPKLLSLNQRLELLKENKRIHSHYYQPSIDQLTRLEEEEAEESSRQQQLMGSPPLRVVSQDVATLTSYTSEDATGTEASFQRLFGQVFPQMELSQGQERASGSMEEDVEVRYRKLQKIASLDAYSDRRQNT